MAIGGQALRQQIVHRVAAFHFDDVALLADVIDRLDQQQFDAVVLAARQPLCFCTGQLVFL